MTKLQVSFPGQGGGRSSPFDVLWTVLCWSAAFGAVVVTTAWAIR